VPAPFALAPFAKLVLPGLLASALPSALLLYLGKMHPREERCDKVSPPGLGLAFLFAGTVAAWRSPRPDMDQLFSGGRQLEGGRLP
jgi:hypothetical protein